MIRNKKIVFLIILTIILSMLSGCGVQNSEKNWYTYPQSFKYSNSKTVAENINYQLWWNSENATVVLRDKKTGAEYSNIPTNASANTSNPQVYSPVMVSYVENESLNIKTVNAKVTSIKNKAFDTEIINNGIKVTYFFQDIAVSVPVYYELRDDSLKVSVKPSEVTEHDNIVYNITILPFFCSINNKSSSTDNYLFVPSGSGALVYPKTIGAGVASLISEPVYGHDYQVLEYNDTSQENIYIPVFGAKNGDTAVCAIIENAAETALINTNIGSSDYAYSAVYSSFNIRGSQITLSKIMGNEISSKTLFCEGKTTENIEVGFYPLYGEEANYAGMAKCFQNYLTKQKNLKIKNNDTLLNLQIYGAISEQKFALGIPYDGLDVLTDFEDVLQISNILSEKYNGKININLLGFGKSGLNLGVIAGGLDYSSKFGDINILKKINNNTDVFFNFDILRFRNNGCGVNNFNSISRDAIGGKTVWKDANISYSAEIESSKGYYYVRRDMLENLGSKLQKKTRDWPIEGVSFDTLTNQTYSDYLSPEYYAKSSFEKQTRNILTNFKNENKKVAATGSNCYAAILADQVFGVPLGSSKYQVYDMDVPFYYMVFKGYTSLAPQPINKAENPRIAFLTAVEVGSGLNYALISKFSQNSVATTDGVFYSCVFKDNITNIVDDIKEYNDFFEKVKNAKIIEHVTTESGLRITSFENGIKVYVNYTENDINYDGITIAALDFEFREEG